ncbi:MAG: hypothetical protein A3H39_15985 [candidate division NC10 bacterium RIFCSPLOWO2_02_FULL_66_22]|nr:MAG: hypothetical protein A3H39_15985 [candidate division NC10 bacterium RIFCSPLOWO2_02_FULL_66_22]
MRPAVRVFMVSPLALGLKFLGVGPPNASESLLGVWQGTEFHLPSPAMTFGQKPNVDGSLPKVGTGGGHFQ